MALGDLVFWNFVYAMGNYYGLYGNIYYCGYYTSMTLLKCTPSISTLTIFLCIMHSNINASEFVRIY